MTPKVFVQHAIKATTFKMEHAHFHLPILLILQMLDVKYGTGPPILAHNVLKVGIL
jgi:hypothetical protein